MPSGPLRQPERAPRLPRAVSRRAVRAAAMLTVLALVIACGGDAAAPEPTPDPEMFSVKVGVWDADQAAFSELQSGQSVNIVMGFQGLVFVNLALLTEAEIPNRFSAEGTLTFEDDGRTLSLYDNQVLFESMLDAHLVPSFRIPFSDSASSLANRTLRLDLVLTSQDLEWQAERTFTFTITDRQCQHMPDGTFVCDE